MRSAAITSPLVYKTKVFTRFQKKARLTDADLWRAVQNAEAGLIDADLGSGVIKQRIARHGQGKSGGSRSILLFRKARRAVYVYGFEKKDRSNLRQDEVDAFKELAAIILAYTDLEMAQRVQDGALFAVIPPAEEHNAQEIP